MSGERVRAARAAAGLSQAALARAAGLSRQAIGALEAGSHRPGVDAALAIARALGCSVEELFATPGAPEVADAVSGGVPADGADVRVAAVGDRRVVVGLGSAEGDGWPLADARMDGGRPAMLPGGRAEGFVALGCDPALRLAEALGPRAGEARLVTAGASTGTALAALADGRAHAALVHGPAAGLPRPPAAVVRLRLARWRVGLAVRAARPPALADLGRSAVVQREPSASVQQAFHRALAAEGLPAPAGPLARGHLDSARRVAAGATAGVTMEPAAVRHGLGFVPIEEHVCEVWVDARWAGHPGTAALGDVLVSRAFRERVAAIGGYDLEGCGERR